MASRRSGAWRIPVAAALMAGLPAGLGARDRADVLEPLTLALVDVSGAAVAVHIAQAEAAAILRELGAEVRWANATPGEPITVAHDAHVVLSPGRAAGRADGRVLMGSAGGPAVAQVYVGGTAAALGCSGKPATWSAQQRRDLSRALGRVIGHEIVHLVAPGHGHAVSGLMASRLTRGALLAGRIEIDPATRAAFQAGLEGRRLRTAALALRP